MNPLWVHTPTVEASSRVPLPDEERRHLAARRVREGDPLVAFDACGRIGTARLATLRKREAEIEIDHVEEVPRTESSFVLASAIPKGERLSTMLQMLSQLGVACWQPLVLDDSAIRKLDSKSRRLDRILIESCKVARRPWSLEVKSVVGLDEILANKRKEIPIAFGDRDGRAFEPAAASGLFLVGPEAGFSEREFGVLEEYKSTRVALGAHNMRIETAAIAVATLYQQSVIAHSGVARGEKASHGSD